MKKKINLFEELNKISDIDSLGVRLDMGRLDHLDPVSIYVYFFIGEEQKYIAFRLKNNDETKGAFFIIQEYIKWLKNKK